MYQVFEPEELFGAEEVQYGEDIVDISKKSLIEFKNDVIVRGEILDIFELKVRNAPITNSPLIDLQSNNGMPINASIKELDNKHKINLLSDVSNILYALIRIKGRTFKVNFKQQGDNVKILCTNKGYTDDDKKNIV